jgi:phosphopantetheine adenylyltransferase
VQRVHVGSTAAFTDHTSQLWAADRAYGTTGPWGYTTAGKAVSSTAAVANTNNPALYQKYREMVGEYRFQVPNGVYYVTLKYAELAVTNATDRRMNVTIEGVRVETDFSVWATVGARVALDRTYAATVSDGMLNIAFARGAGARKDPAVAAIEVVYGVAPTPTPTATPSPTPTITPTPTPYLNRVHSGSTAAFTDGVGRVWVADRAYGTTGPWGYTTGSAVSNTTAVAGTTDDALYQKYREIAGEYRFQVPNGVYQVTLKFAEMAVTNATDRRMNITIEGVRVETDFSVWGVVGKAVALDRTYTTTVSDGLLNITFAKGASARKSPAINAIEVRVQ